MAEYTCPGSDAASSGLLPAQNPPTPTAPPPSGHRCRGEFFGITDWLTEQEHEEPTLQQYDQSILGDPVKDRQSYEDASPIKYFKDAKAPLLILQGTNDIRDPKEEAEQAERILKKEGKVVDSHYYADEGHGFAKRENQIDAMQRTVDWFDKYLKPKP